MNKITLMLALVLLPCIATASPITTYAVHPIVAAPQGDEIGGALVEAFVPAGMVISPTVGNLEFGLNNVFLTQGMVIQPTVGNLDFGIVTHAVNPIGIAPQGDEIGGAWIESFVMQGMMIQPSIGNLEFGSEYEFEVQGMAITPIIGNYGTINWEPGVQWEDGVYWENDEITLVVPDRSVDVIAWDSF